MTGIVRIVEEICQSPEVRGILSVSAAGVLGAVVNLALEERALVLPRLEAGKLYLGFVGNLMICLAAAYLAGQSFERAFLAALCGSSLLRSMKSRVEQAYDREIKGIRGEVDE